MAAGDYIPKFKVGYTVLCQGEETHYIVFATFRSLGQFSPDFVNGSAEYDERDESHVLYAVFDPVSCQTCWRWECILSLYCCNPNRGKKTMLEPANLKRISEGYSIHDEGLVKFTAMLADQPPET